jgi:hypothetical protein
VGISELISEASVEDALNANTQFAKDSQTTTSLNS